ncbi:hypothetical protein FA15DRAFT_678411 [Coprinopsis marcescibilis]|uniref:Uncharacterized protein n=1 Tax=Coprinopsis marcescibilis TaxID=230819 RepID=A0A5C3L698_COPMA|nr:hypothetical protein FA15DRAFT_678411 [Coprinopsis marcescibilis]
MSSRWSCGSSRSSLSSAGGFDMPPIFSSLGYMNVVLPLEIINMILYELEDHLPSLKSFSLSCRYFCKRTRPFIFRCISLSMHITRYNSHDDLEDLLTTSRYLIPHIQKVNIRALFPEDSEDGTSPDPEALRVLLNLRDVVKEIAIHGGSCRSWTAVPVPIQIAIRTTLRGKHISSVEAASISDFPVYLLDGCLSLKDLSLNHKTLPSCYPVTKRDGLAYQVMTFMQSQEDKSPVYLDRLYLKVAAPSLIKLGEWLLSDECSLDVSRLRSLEVHAPDVLKGVFYERQLILEKILDRCRDTLEELHLDVWSPDHSIEISAPCPGKAQACVDRDCEVPVNVHTPTVMEMYERLDIGKLKSLRRLSLKFGIPNICDPKKHILLVNSMLKNVRRLEDLQHISLLLFTQGTLTPALSNGVMTSGSWEALDRVLAGDATTREDSQGSTHTGFRHSAFKLPEMRMEPPEQRNMFRRLRPGANGNQGPANTPNGSFGAYILRNARSMRAEPHPPCLNRPGTFKIVLANTKDHHLSQAIELFNYCLPRLSKTRIVDIQANPLQFR